MAKISAQPVPPVHPDDEDEHPLDVQGLLHFLLRRAWLVILAAVLAGAAAWALTRNMPELFQAAAVIEIATQAQKAIDLRDDSQTNLQNPEVVETIIERFDSRALMERVNKALGLASDPRFLGFKPVKSAPDDLVVAMLLGSTKAVLRPRTRLVDVTFTHRDPTVAYQVVNALVDEFLKQDTEQRAKTQADQYTVLTEKAQILKDKVNQSELDLQNYKKNVESVSLEDRRNLVEEKLKGLNSDLTNAKAERLRLESDADQARKVRGTSAEQLLGIPSLAQDPQVAAARERLQKEEESMTTLSQRYGPLHPRMIEEKAQLDAARGSLAEAVRTAPERIGSQLAAARAREDSLQRAVRDQESAQLDLDAKVIPFRALQREYDSNRALFEAVLQRLKESNVQLGVQTVEFQVVEPAIAAYHTPNRRPLLIAVGTLLGAGLAGGLLLLVFFLNKSISTVESAEALLRLPVLAAVPQMRSGISAKESVAAMDRPNSQEAESFRSLRTALQLIGGESNQVILITSAVPGEGKSVSAGNIAVAFAQLGLQTLLIEADLRKPTLDSLFLPKDQKSVGLGDYLRGEAVQIVATAQKNLSYLSAGTPLNDPAESLSSPRFASVIETAKAAYQRIIIDTAPVNVVSDTLNIVGCASAVCLVVRSNSTPQKQVRRAVELLKRSGVRPDGLILNWTRSWTGRKYKGYYQEGTGYRSRPQEQPAVHPAPAASA